MGNTQTVYLPPWVPTTDEEKARSEEYTKAVKEIASLPRNFVTPHAVAQSADFPFDWATHRAFAEAAYTNDARLAKLLPRLVPKHVSEEAFWRSYFSHVYAVKVQFGAFAEPVVVAALPAPAVEPSGSPVAPALANEPEPVDEAESEATRLARASSLTSQLQYPERFELALQYVTHGPSLPHDAAPGDRILMDVLSQQATVGQCNAPRPGMWDSAEAKARHEAWVKLGSMSKHEAMHLYVQALEIFRKDWVLWEGLAIAPEKTARADAVTPAKRRPGSALASPAPDGAAAAAAASAARPAPPSAAAAPPPAAAAERVAAGASLEGANSDGANSDLCVYLLDISPSSRAVAMLLELLPAARGVQVFKVGRIADLPEPVQRGCAKLPLLLDSRTQFELWDAHAIMGFLVDKYALPGRTPPDFSFPLESHGRAKVQQFLAYRQATLWPAVRDHVFAQLFPASPVCPVSHGSALREYVENGERRLQMELNRLNTVFLEQAPFLTGETPTMADISCACAVSLLDWVSSPRIEHYPNVASWFASVGRLPGYKQASLAHAQFAATANNKQQGHFALALIE